ncbi:MAG TPA: hypothetical protein VFG50_07945 [Rhodothermales bacterium]|nr:hypothetical protein [Rhodothermales bacterium]
MTRNEARQTIGREGRKNTVVVYFTKRDGEARRMVCRYCGASSRRPHLMEVWDMEKGAVRCVNLDTVTGIRVCVRPTETEAAREERSRRKLEEISALFSY